jgi:ferritin
MRQQHRLISDAMNAAINEQIGNEFYASLQYVAIATYFDAETLPELARHFYRQSFVGQ